MSYDAPEFPYLGAIIILLLNVVEDLIVGENFLISIIIDGAAELETISMAMGIGIMSSMTWTMQGTESLAILMGIKQEGVTNKVRGMKCWELR